MERDPQQSPEGGEGANHENEHETEHGQDGGAGYGPESGPEPEPIYERLSDEQHIERGIQAALDAERAIDDATARRIAGQLHGGQASKLYSLASSGALPESLERELAESVQDLPGETHGWVDALLAYTEARGEDRGPREGWAALTADDPEAEAARAAASRERRTDRERLERYVELGLDPGDAEALIEYERLSPEQRAQWAGIAPVAPDAVSQEPAETTAGPEATAERQPGGLQPRIYVADLAAYNHGQLHGVWLDAAREVDELWDDVRAMLARSPVPGAEEIAIHDYEDFASFRLSEHENLDVIARVAQGVAEHGEPFAAYADWNRAEDPELAHFDEAFEGTFPSREAWAREIAEEVFEWPRYREQIPEPLQSHVTLDLASFARDLEQDRHVVDGESGVYVFNPDA